MSASLPSPSRRRFIRRTATATAAAVASGMSAFAAPAIISGKRRWKMVLTWQKVLPGLGTGAVRLAERITRLSEGKLEVKVYGGGELVPPLGIFDAVSEGVAEIGHTAPYYWLSKNRSFAFFTSVPGGFTAQEQNAWLYFGDGLKLWHALAAPFNLVSFPAGNTGTQMGGWFTRELRTLDDLQGLKMRIPGLAGEIFAKLGGNPQVIPPQELFTALQSGVIDALEWVGPWNDVALGFHRIATHYYGPGFHEPGATLELMLNRDAYLSLPAELQQVVKVAAATENQLMLSEYTARNLQAMREIRRSDVRIAPYPEPVLKAFFETAEGVLADTAAAGDISRKIYESFADFRRGLMRYGAVTEHGFLEGRGKWGGKG